MEEKNWERIEGRKEGGREGGRKEERKEELIDSFLANHQSNVTEYMQQEKL